MNTKHTPGPWENKNGNISGQWETGQVGIAIVGTTRFCGDEVGGPKAQRMQAEDKANARLIAAAPDLLAAVERFLTYADNGNHPHYARYTKTFAGMQLRAAVAKAKGQP